MKKIFILASLVAAFTSLNACSNEKEGAGKLPTPVVASAPAGKVEVVNATAIANATVSCGPGEIKTAKALGENAKVTASCGSQKAPIAKVKAATSRDASLIRKLAHENADLKVKIAAASSAVVAVSTVSVSVGVMPLIPRFSEEGRVYNDAEGNTFERHKGGSRECKFYVNGELVKRQFVQHPDLRESKKECDLLAAIFLAGLTPTTPEVAATTSSLPSAATAVVSVASGDVTCELKFDGKVVETTKTANDSSCKVWTLAKAREKGWIAK